MMKRKFLSFVPHHEPQAIRLALDSEGGADMDALIAATAQEGHTLPPQETLGKPKTAKEKK